MTRGALCAISAFEGCNRADVNPGDYVMRRDPEFQRRQSLPWPRRGRAAVLLACRLGGLAHAGGYAVRNGTVAGGGAVASAGAYRVISTVAEPVMGSTSAGNYRLTAGFPATLPNTLPPSGNIFADGFE